jgi:hypothetical protein
MSLAKIKYQVKFLKEIVIQHHLFIFIFHLAYLHRLYNKIDYLNQDHKEFHGFNLMIEVATAYDFQL